MIHSPVATWDQVSPSPSTWGEKAASVNRKGAIAARPSPASRVSGSAVLADRANGKAKDIAEGCQSRDNFALNRGRWLHDARQVYSAGLSRKLIGSRAPLASAFTPASVAAVATKPSHALGPTAPPLAAATIQARNSASKAGSNRSGQSANTRPEKAPFTLRTTSFCSARLTVPVSPITSPRIS